MNNQLSNLDFRDMVAVSGDRVITTSRKVAAYFVPLATETGQWLYFAPADVKRVEFTPVSAEQAEQPEEQTAE